MNKIFNGDNLKELKKLKDNSVDLLCTDPPYGYSFMGKDWDKAVPTVELWKECLRVLKPGAFAFIMSAPRSDVLSRMIVRIEDAGFRVDFTPLYWTYASGFPKAMNVGKKVDKRNGVKGRVVGEGKAGAAFQYGVGSGEGGFGNIKDGTGVASKKWDVHEVVSNLDGSYGGFQPKPAVEVIIVAMKPLSEKTYVDQALKNGKGITWLDDCRIPTEDDISNHSRSADAAVSKGKYGDSKAQETHKTAGQELGRFPANLLVSDNVLGDHSRFFALPFLIVPKASKREKGSDNNHLTVKPLTLMQYLITLGSREGDVVLDPFLGSGTTAIAAKQLGRQYLGMEREKEYAERATARIAATKEQPPSLFAA